MNYDSVGVYVLSYAYLVGLTQVKVLVGYGGVLSKTQMHQQCGKSEERTKKVLRQRKNKSTIVSAKRVHMLCCRIVLL